MIVFLLAGFLLGSAATLYADIYMWTDPDGVIHFTNAPTASGYRLYLREKSRRSSMACVPDKYDHFITAASERHGIEFPLLKAIIKAESGFNPKAVSKKGAKGLMQIMPFNFKALKINDPFDPWENIMGGTTYFKQLLDRFEGKLKLALAAYNAGPQRVEESGSIPPIKETEEYVRRVIKYYRSLKENRS